MGGYDAFYGGEMLLLKGERCRGRWNGGKCCRFCFFFGIRPELIDGLVMAPLWLPSNNHSKPERQPDLRISPRCWEISEILEFTGFNESA